MKRKILSLVEQFLQEDYKAFINIVSDELSQAELKEIERTVGRRLLVQISDMLDKFLRDTLACFEKADYDNLYSVTKGFKPNVISALKAYIDGLNKAAAEPRGATGLTDKGRALIYIDNIIDTVRDAMTAEDALAGTTTALGKCSKEFERKIAPFDRLSNNSGMYGKNLEQMISMFAGRINQRQLMDIMSLPDTLIAKISRGLFTYFERITNAYNNMSSYTHQRYVFSELNDIRLKAISARDAINDFDGEDRFEIDNICGSLESMIRENLPSIFREVREDRLDAHDEISAFVGLLMELTS